jgi:hypothetical protein
VATADAAEAPVEAITHRSTLMGLVAAPCHGARCRGGYADGGFPRTAGSTLRNSRILVKKSCWQKLCTGT